MSQKRHQDDGFRKSPSEGDPSDDKRRKFPSFKTVVREVMKLHEVQRLEPVLEPLVRRVVKEEVELALKKYLTSMKWNCRKEMHPSESRSLQLQFENPISLPVFTGTRIEAEECTTLQVSLIDALSGKVVCSGPESSVKLELVALEGDFDGDERNNWTIEEFKNNIVREREGKKPLLTGDTVLNLNKGIGFVGDISFTDNSSWTRSRKFRLGARVVENFDGTRVREAKTESFIVRDHRGELYKKHHPPSLVDEVWRLEKIGKDGAFHKRLSKAKINTVKDFLTQLFLDPTGLRNILGTGMSAKMWEVTVDHAYTCVIDETRYLYSPLGCKTRVVFNVVGQLRGILSDGQYIPADKLPETEKADAHNLVISAYRNWNEVVPFEDEASLMDSTSHLSNVLYPSNSPTTGSSDVNKVLTSQKIGRSDYLRPSISSPDIMPSFYSIGGVSVDDYGLQNIDSMDVRFDQPFSFPGQEVNLLISDTDSVTQAFCETEHLPYLDTDCSLQNLNMESESDLHGAVNGFLSNRSAAALAKRRWRVLCSVFRVRRWIASKIRVTERQRYY